MKNRFSFLSFFLTAAFVAALFGITNPVAASQAYCWCLDPASGACENHTRNDGDQAVIDFTDQTDPVSCDSYCTNNGKKATNFDRKGYLSRELFFSGNSQDACPMVGNGGDCWCFTPNGTCEHHTQTDNEQRVILIDSQTQCNAYCQDKSKQAANFDDHYINREGQAVGNDPAKACPSKDAADSSSSTKTGSVKGSSTNLYDPLGVNGNLFALIGRIIRAVIGIVGALVLLAFVYGGFLWMTGDMGSGQVKRAKQVMTSATIGLLIIFFSYAVLNLFLSAFHFDV